MQSPGSTIVIPVAVKEEIGPISFPVLKVFKAGIAHHPLMFIMTQCAGLTLELSVLKLNNSTKQKWPFGAMLFS